MSAFSFISFPREVDLRCLLNNKTCVHFDELVDFHGIKIFESGATFDNVFTNFFVYSFMAAFRLLDEKKYMEDCKENYVKFGKSPDTDMDIEFYTNMLNENNERSIVCRQQLYDLVQVNIKANEIVEIYTGWVDNKNIFTFGPPVEERIIDADQILKSELLDIRQRVKIEIRRTK